MTERRMHLTAPPAGRRPFLAAIISDIRREILRASALPPVFFLGVSAVRG
jgi:hypothetical protein